jgi:hypothetical protein
MNKTLALLSCFIFVLALAGCGQQNGKMSSQPQLEGETGEDVLPEFLVGVWEADEFRWGFKFERDGSISKLIHTMGMRINVGEGGYYEEGADGSNAMYAMGPCEASYDPNTRELDVKIVLDYFRMEFPTGSLEGKSIDYFTGVVSEDGEIWEVEWRNYGWLDGANPPDPNLIEANPQKLTFSKLDMTQIIHEGDVQ